VQNDEVQLLASWPVNGPAESGTGETIVDFHYLNNSTFLCCILSGGDIFLIKTEAEESEEKIQIIGNMETGILAAQWTVDEETLAIASGTNRHIPPPLPAITTNFWPGDSKLVFMTSTFETITEIALSPTDISQHINQVSVGWGRSETQFRGLRAKNAPRDPTLPERVDEGILSQQDDQKTHLHWRADGEFLALSRIEREEGKPGGRRVVRVYSRDGQIESFSEPIDGLEGTLSWRPSGQWIATVKRGTDDTAEIVFLERNGLRHGGFALGHLGAGEVRDLSWNSDSSCLGVLLRDHIQLWMMSNYNWKLKAEIARFEEPGGFDFVWHPEKPNILFVNNGGEYSISRRVTDSDAVERYEFVLDLCNDYSTPPSDYGLVAVIDGGTHRHTLPLPPKKKKLFFHLCNLTRDGQKH